MSDKQPDLLTKAGALLLDAAGLLRMEAGEWRSRKKEQPKNFDAMTDAAWADKCERVAKINEQAATAMLDHAKLIAQAKAPMTKHIPHPANALFRTLEKLARDTDASQHDEHYRDYLNEIARRGEIVIRMPDGLLHLEDYTVDERTGERWVFTDKGRAVFAGVE